MGAAPMDETYHLIHNLRVPSGKSLAKNAESVYPAGWQGNGAHGSR